MKEKGAPRFPAEAARFLDHLAVEKGLSKNTILAYQRDLKEFYSLFDSLERRTVDEYFALMRQEKYSSSTISRRISSLRSLERFLALTDASRKPWKIETGRTGRRLPKALGYESIRRLIESTSSDSSGLRDRAILEVLYATGMRVSECVGLNLNQIDSLESDISFIRVIGKGNKERIVPLGGYALKACSDYLVMARPALSRNLRESALFLNNNGRRLSRQGIWQIINRAAIRAQIEERVTPHSFRHSFATHMIERGADVRSVQELLGHASVVTTQIYTLITQDILREAHAESHPRAR